MAVVVGPCLSLSAQKTFGKCMTFQKKGRGYSVSRPAIPSKVSQKNPTPLQQEVRQISKIRLNGWKNETQHFRDWWIAEAENKNFKDGGYQYFIKHGGLRYPGYGSNELFIVCYTDSRLYIVNRWTKEIILSTRCYPPLPVNLSGGRDVVVDCEYIYILGYVNGKIYKIKRDFSVGYTYFKSWGTGDNQIKGAVGCCMDDTHFFIGEVFNDRVSVFLKSDLSFVTTFGSIGAGDENFDRMNKIIRDGNVVLICDRYNKAIKKWDKDTFQYVGKIDITQQPYSICHDEVYYYLGTLSPVAVIKIRKDTGEPIKQYSVPGGGVGDITLPIAQCVDNAYLYIVDWTLNKVLVLNKFTLEYITEYKTGVFFKDGLVNPGGIRFYGTNC